MLPADAPPVPPLPAQFLGQKADHLSGSTIRGYDSYVRGHRDMGADADVDMMDEDEWDRFAYWNDIEYDSDGYHDIDIERRKRRHEAAST